MCEASNGKEEKKSTTMHSTEIKRRLYKHRGDHRFHEKIDKEISVSCDKIITCCDKIRRKSKKDAKSADEIVPIVTLPPL